MGTAILLSGAPGSGKTTAIQKILSGLDIPTGGFYTREMRSGGVRIGFELVTLDGRRGVLAHVDTPGPPRVGKYGVDLSVLNGVGVASIQSALEECSLVVIDEVGPMEILSPAFRQVVLDALESDKAVLGSISRRENPFTSQVRRHPNVDVLEINLSNRDNLVRILQERLKKIGLEKRT